MDVKLLIEEFKLMNDAVLAKDKGIPYYIGRTKKLPPTGRWIKKKKIKTLQKPTFDSI